MATCTPPFNLTAIELARLPANIEDWALRNTSIARTLRDTLHEAIMDLRINPRLAHRMLHRIMPATIKTFHEQVFDGDCEHGVRTCGKIVNYRNFEGMWTLFLKDVTIELQAGEPNPMLGYNPSARDKLKGKGKASNPYDLTGEDDDVAYESTVVQLAASSSGPASGSKRSYDSMMNDETSNATKIFGTSGKKGSYTILIPKLTIRMVPSGYLTHYQASPQNGKGALTRGLGRWEEERMVRAGRKMERRVRGPNKPRKKRITGVKVGREDLDDDEVDEEEEGGKEGAGK